MMRKMVFPPYGIPVGHYNRIERQVEKPVESSAKRIPTVSSSQALPLKVNRHSEFTIAEIRKLANTSLYWHKFYILRGAGYDKKDLVHSLIRVVAPHNIAPVMFKQEGGDVTFLLRTCLSVIDRIVENKLRIAVCCFGPLGSDIHELDIEILLRDTPVQEFNINPTDIVKTAVLKRLDQRRGSLDLSSFLDDEELSSTVLWPLWLGNSMQNVVLPMVRIHWATIQIVNLSDNNLSSVAYLVKLPNLRVLDVSGNDLQDVNVLKELRSLPIRELSLDRNPLCLKYDDERSYIWAVRAVAPYVRKLDGLYIPRRPDMPCWRQNYIPPDHRAECTALVDQFLQHFFTLLDGDDRMRLRGMYHPYALFSLTCEEGCERSHMTLRLVSYGSENRNLLHISDSTKRQQLLRQGAEEVLATLCRLPATEHDPHSFAVDVPFFNHDAAMIVVHGVFREPSNIKDMFAFSRLFILRKVDEYEYQIANEMLSVRKARVRQIKESFLHPKLKGPQAKPLFNPAQDLSDADRDQLTKILSSITDMNRRWATKVLEESKWDIKKALLVFRELLRMKTLPAEALLSEEERSEHRNIVKLL